MTNDLTRGKPLPIIIRFALPLMLAALFQQIYTMTDMYVAGNVIGSRALAVIGVSNAFIFSMTIVMSGLTAGFTAMASRHFGAGEASLLKQTVVGSLYIALACAVFFAALGIFGAEPVMRLLNTPDDIYADTVVFVRICFGGSAGMILSYSAYALLRAVGDSKTPLIFLIVTSVLNVLLDILFIWTLNMGVNGAALALVTAQCVSAAVMLAYMRRRFELFRLSGADFAIPFKIVWDILKIGLPAATQSTLLAFGDMVVAGVVNTYGSDMAAAYSTGNRIVLLHAMFVSNLSLAHAVYAGQNLGAKKLDRIREGFRKTAFLSLALSAIIGLFVYFYGHLWVRLFIAESDAHIESIVSLTNELLHVHGASFLFLGMIFFYNNTLRGMGRMGAPFLSGIGELTAKVGFSFLFTLLFGYAGLWYVYPMGWILGILPPLIWFHLGRWKKGVAAA